MAGIGEGGELDSVTAAGFKRFDKHLFSVEWNVTIVFTVESPDRHIFEVANITGNSVRIVDISASGGEGGEYFRVSKTQLPDAVSAISPPGEVDLVWVDIEEEL
jgi:hypothetical protein